MNKNCFIKIKERAYLVGYLFCSECGIELDLDEEASDPMEKWAQQSAEVAKAQGWGCSEENKIVCSNCLKKIL